MISRPNIQNQQASNKVAPSIWVGRILLVIGSAWLVAAAIYTAYVFVMGFVNQSVDWSDPLTALVTGARPVICILFIIGAIGGISFVLDKGPFISVAAFAAFVLFIVLIAALIIDVRNLVNNGWDWPHFFLSLLDVEMAALLYFLGWFFAKNWLD